MAAAEVSADATGARGQDGVAVIPPRPWYRPAKLPLGAAARGGSVALGQVAEDSF